MVNQIVSVVINGDSYRGLVVDASKSGAYIMVEMNTTGEVQKFTRRANGAYKLAGRNTLRVVFDGGVDKLDPHF